MFFAPVRRPVLLCARSCPRRVRRLFVVRYVRCWGRCRTRSCGRRRERQSDGAVARCSRQGSRQRGGRAEHSHRRVCAPQSRNIGSRSARCSRWEMVAAENRKRVGRELGLRTITATMDQLLRPARHLLRSRWTAPLAVQPLATAAWMPPRSRPLSTSSRTRQPPYLAAAFRNHDWAAQRAAVRLSTRRTLATRPPASPQAERTTDSAGQPPLSSAPPPAAAPPPKASTAAEAAAEAVSTPGLGSPKERHENIYTIPNALTVARIIACPAIGYYILQGDLATATALLFVAGVSDLVESAFFSPRPPCSPADGR